MGDEEADEIMKRKKQEAMDFVGREEREKK
jgi:hypothetical protein